MPFQDSIVRFYEDFLLLLYDLALSVARGGSPSGFRRGE